MGDARLQLAAQYWTSATLVEKIDAFQQFISSKTAIVKERQSDFVRFDIIGNNTSVQVIFRDDIETIAPKFDNSIFKLIFLPNGSTQSSIDKIINATNTFAFLFEDDLDFIVQGLQIEELALYKVFYHFIKGNSLEARDYDKDDVQLFYHNSLKRKTILADFDFDKILEKVTPENHPRNNVRHYKTSLLLAELKKNGVSNIILSGKSASGKTTFTYSLADELTPHFKCYFIESTILDDEVIAGIAIDLIKHLNESDTPLLLIVDDLQSNLDGAKKIIQFWNYLQAKFENKRNISFIGVIWDDFTNEVKHLFNKTPLEISISASDLVANLIARCNKTLSKEENAILTKFADNNLFILSLAIKYLNDDDEKPIAEILNSIPELVLDSLIVKANEPDLMQELKRLFFCLSLFGQYEIDLTNEFLRKYTNCTWDFIESLFEKNVIRKRGNGTTLGHKSYSRIIFECLQQETSILEWYRVHKRLSTNADFILEFLRGLQPNQIYSILKKLYENSDTSIVSNVIIDTWQSIDKILGKILFQQKIDSTWNSTASSALFAIQTLDNFGFREEAEKSIDFFRSFYSVNGDRIDISLENLSEVKDFRKIKECLVKQDKTENLNGEKGEELDEIEFYKNWLSGVILSAEGFHKSLSESDLLRLAGCVENQTLDQKYFYPERVSWCTSRVLIGLGLCGRSIHNSKVVLNTAEWLLSHPNYDDANGCWVSGTGTWNHWFEATALAISGLLSVGVSPEHPKVKRGVANLLSQKSLFTAKNMELDGIFAIQTLSQAEVNLFEVQNEIKILSEWMTTKADWASVRKTSDETFRQSCQISQSSAGIVDVMWKMVRNDLPTVVRVFDKKMAPKEDVRIFVSYEWGSQNFVKDLVEELYLRYGKKNILFDLKDNNNVSSTHYMEEINKVDITLYLCTKKYKEKADNRMGGVGNEAEHISKGLYERLDRFIPILLEGDWKTEFMPNFWTNTIGITCLSKKLEERTKEEMHKLIKTKFSNNRKK